MPDKVDNGMCEQVMTKTKSAGKLQITIFHKTLTTTTYSVYSPYFK